MATLKELAEYRQQSRIKERWGTGWQYGRVVRCPKGEVESKLSSDLALGTRIESGWYDGSLDTDIADPLLQSVQVRQMKGGGFDELHLTYIGIDVEEAFGNTHSGYAATTDFHLIQHGQFAAVYEEWGISSSGAGPSPGDEAGDWADIKAVCQKVEYSDSLEGRVLLRSIWIRPIGHTVLQL